jgi:hypothetical protein
MNLVARFGLVVLCAGILPAAALAQEQGYWRAESSTAKGVTGDIEFGNDKLMLDFYTTPLAEIRDLKPGEVSAVFDVDADSATAGRLYRVSIPAGKSFLHHSKLCGSEDTQWVATYAVRRQLQVAFFSGSSMPVFTPEAIGSATNLCGTYSYVR